MKINEKEAGVGPIFFKKAENMRFVFKYVSVSIVASHFCFGYLKSKKIFRKDLFEISIGRSKISFFVFALILKTVECN